MPTLLPPAEVMGSVIPLDYFKVYYIFFLRICSQQRPSASE